MLRNRFLIFLGVCFLAASAAWADDVGYVDCSNHSEGTQVFGKPRKTPDVVASLPCGERFTILVYGFVFSRIETRDGKVGYVYSNLIAVDRSASPVLQPASERIRVPAAKPTSMPATVAQPTPPAPAQPQPEPAQPASTLAASAQPSVPTSPGPISPAATSNVPETTATVAQPAPPSPGQLQPAPAPVATAQPAPTPVSEPTSPATTLPGPTSPTAPSNVPETSAAVAQPDPPASTQPEPTPAQPAAPAIRPAETRTTWEKPNPGGVRRAPLIELFGGYAFARLYGGGGTTSNLNGAMGSFGWNLKPWLQIVADSSYSFVTVGTTKNVLYGNHYGPRYFHRGRNRWGVTPFVEALFGASRADTTVSGVGGYATSTNSFSIKAGGGLDIRPSRRLEIRLFDIDYYRTSFGANVYQNNYWASAGIVLRLFGGSSGY